VCVLNAECANKKAAQLREKKFEKCQASGSVAANNPTTGMQLQPGDPDGLITVILATQQQLKQQRATLNGAQVVDYVSAALSPCEKDNRNTASATLAIKSALSTRQSQVNIPIGNVTG